MSDSNAYKFVAPEQAALFPVAQTDSVAKAKVRTKRPKATVSKVELAPITRSTKKSTKGNSVVIRETFSIPPGESVKIENTRRRCAIAGVLLNRSEVIRAGIAALQKLDEASFLAVVSSVQKLKTGRPTA